MSIPKLSKVDTMRHSVAHLLAWAVKELWPEAKFGVGPVVEHGFFYDIDLPVRLRDEDLPKIEEKMRELKERNEPYVRREMSVDQAIAFFKELRQEYKLELLRDLKRKGTTKVREEEHFDVDPDAREKTSVYETGSFVDLCRGPHVKSTREIGAFKLTKLAGAYWRGSEKNPQLQRIYGVAFATDKELEHHLWQLEEAKKRDHRRIGQEQELFTFDDLVGKGLPLWLPKGTIMRDEIERLAVEMEHRAGYERVATPHLGKEELYRTSGHLPYYAESMYPPMDMDDGRYYLKAMNCPHHHLIYRSRLRSYRELPLRLAEYGTVYRNELSGTLAGLLRVRMLSMNDAHIYCRRDQIEDEFAAVLQLTTDYFKLFGLTDYWFRLSKWDPVRREKYFQEPENWEYTEAILRSVLQRFGVPFVEADDEAAFYGPKVDVQFTSVIGREETMSTIQLDFVAKERFGLSFKNEKGEDDRSVFVIHRAPLSTHERFMAFLIEHYAGAFPVWLSPVQVTIIPVGEAHVAGARALGEHLRAAGARIDVRSADETVGNHIRRAAEHKVPYIIVVGDRELPPDGTWTKESALQVRHRGTRELQAFTLGSFLERFQQHIATRLE